MSEIEEVVEDAMRVLDERGWCQGDWSDDEGRLCMLGALRVANYGVLTLTVLDQPVESRVGDDEFNAFVLEIGATITRETGHYGIGTWNDEHAEGPEEVKLMLKKAVAEFTS